MSTPQTTGISWDESALRKFRSYFKKLREATKKCFAGRFETNKSSSSRTSNPEDENEKQDWNQVTEEKDSWANRERRRSSVWSGLDGAGVAKKRSDSGSASEHGRKGSILSLWSSGKDQDGKHVLHHDDHDEVVIVDDGEVVEKKKTAPTAQSPTAPRFMPEGRRGSILSMWKSGTDEKGRPIIHHLDD